MPTYNPSTLEPKWQQFWLNHKTFRTPEPGDPAVAGKPKYYILDMFPYPSGAGLHVGHPEGYTATDILARYKRMQGFHVLHPMGWDAFGLPAENHAVKTGTHPAITTTTNINNFREQIQMLGFSYDWDREVNTTDPGYYRWTQWIFLQLYDTWYDPSVQKGRPIAELPIPADIAAAGADAVREYQDDHRLAYISDAPVNWCPALGTVLANEEVIDGKSEVGGHPVERRPMQQWMLRITAYAERLLADLDQVNWPESIKKLQRDWIGRSEGAEVDFPVLPAGMDSEATVDWIADRLEKGFAAEPEANVIRVYTTRPDTLFGATYMVLAPEHPLVATITTEQQRPEVDAYIQAAARKSERDRADDSKTKSGVFTGAYAFNLANRQAIPIFIADYVLWGYGTGAIMAVPAHDERDFAFAQKYGLDIIDVVSEEQPEFAGYLQAQRWMGDWERDHVDAANAADRPYLKVAHLVGCSFDAENFRTDCKEAQGKRDPIWAHVRLHRVDEDECLVAFVHEDFPALLEVYFEATDDSLMSLYSFEESDEAEDDSDDETDLDAWAASGSDQDGHEEDDDEAQAAAPRAPYANWGEVDDRDRDDDEDDAEEDGEDFEDDDEEGDLYGALEAALGPDAAFTGDGIAINSSFLSGLPTAEAKAAMIAWLEQHGIGRKRVNFKLRDWLFSRQRYWGEPFPILRDSQGRARALDESELPLLLPEMEDFKPTGTPEPPLSKAPASWLRVERDGEVYTRETNTMPQWAGSCWYYLRYLDPTNTAAPWDRAKEQYWMPVDLYVGGAEHAVLHLLYSRFWHKVLYDRGHVSTAEPFQRLFNQGMILGKMEFTGHQVNGEWVNPKEVEKLDDGTYVWGKKQIPAVQATIDPELLEKRDERWVLKGKPSLVFEGRAHKMSKARGNVVNPNDVVAEYGADALRGYEMFMGPLEATKPWSMDGVAGVARWLNRAWRMIIDDRAEAVQLAAEVVDDAPDRDTLRLLHQTIRGVTADLEGMRFNTAISKLMEFVNGVSRLERRPRAVLEPFVLLLAPIAPHLAEELWAALGHPTSLAYEPWPMYDDALAAADEVEVAIQINGKVKSKLTVPADISDDALIAQAQADDKIIAALAGQPIAKAFVKASNKGKLVTLVLAK